MTTPNRRQSFKVQATPVPVPPSLVSSPYLSPNSMFNKEYAFPRVPAGSQDAWLRDQVPQRQQQSQQQGSQQPAPAQAKGAAQPSQKPAQAPKPGQQPPKS
ncbi:hypothetical protein EXIGLDRAFT_770834 [Exidia glandulosa HHB12029]|uniref:Uncharacterized protein n=1 Tax=Exidia glandulosa HHB12029 TaxID=1314781 RepID=A0A165GEW2_EXIGL|nr:hypothetical protein EXIGLDRAFT_770834 [Exidia glandulosa HHB12029]